MLFKNCYFFIRILDKNFETVNRKKTSLIGNVKFIKLVKNIILNFNKKIFTMKIKLFNTNIGRYKTTLRKKSKLR